LVRSSAEAFAGPEAAILGRTPGGFAAASMNIAAEAASPRISLSFKYLWATAQKCLEKWSHSRLSL